MVELGPVGIFQDVERGEHTFDLERGLRQLASFVKQQAETKVIGSARQVVSLLVNDGGPLDQHGLFQRPSLEFLGIFDGLERLESRSELSADAPEILEIGQVD